jgi:hypothetical protein
MSQAGCKITPPSEFAPQSGAFAGITHPGARVPKTPPKTTPPAPTPPDGKGGRSGGKGGKGKGGGKGGKGGKGGQSPFPSSKMAVYSKTVDDFILDPDPKSAFATLANALNRMYKKQYQTPLFLSTTGRNPSVSMPVTINKASNCTWVSCVSPDGCPVDDLTWASFKFLCDLLGVHSRDQEFNGLTSLGFWYSQDALTRTPSLDWHTIVQTLRPKIKSHAAPKSSPASALYANSYSLLNAPAVHFDEEAAEDGADDEDSDEDP